MRVPSRAVAACKRAVYEGGSLPLSDGLRLEPAEFLAGILSPEAEEAMATYVAETERTGRLPGYEPDQLERALASGRFG